MDQHGIFRAFFGPTLAEQVEEFRQKTGYTLSDVDKEVLTRLAQRQLEWNPRLIPLPLTKDTADMSEPEKLSIAIAAGCHFDAWIGEVDGELRMTIKTKNAIGIRKAGDFFHIYEREV